MVKEIEGVEDAFRVGRLSSVDSNDSHSDARRAIFVNEDPRVEPYGGDIELINRVEYKRYFRD